MDKIFIGYELRTVPNVEELMPEFSGRTGTNDPEKIAEQIRVAKENWKLEAQCTPYTGTLAKVSIIIPSKEKAVIYDSTGRLPFKGPKTSVALATKQFIIKLFQGAWGNDIAGSHGSPKAVFVGFRPKLFLKILGIELTLPVTASPAPTEMWYGNTDHRDIEEAVKPKDFKFIDWPMVIKARRAGLSGEDAEKFDALFAGWEGPNQSAEKDASIAVLLAGQLGWLDS